MKYTPEERRRKINVLIHQDRDCFHMDNEFWTEKEEFEKFVDKLPGFVRDRRNGYPTMCYMYHQRIMTLVCDQMRFPEEQ